MEQAFMRGLSVDIQSRYFSIVNLLHQLDLQEETDDEKESAAIRKSGEIHGSGLRPRWSGFLQRTEKEEDFAAV